MVVVVVDKRLSGGRAVAVYSCSDYLVDLWQLWL